MPGRVVKVVLKAVIGPMEEEFGMTTAGAGVTKRMN